MHRREFISLVGGTVALLPGVLRAQQTTTLVIGFLGSETAAAWTDRVAAFQQGLADSGYVEGRNVAIEYRWAEGSNNQLPALAADLVRRQVSILVVLGGTASVLAAKAATATIPVVFRIAIDPVEAGVVASISRPGGNLTGVTTMGADLGSKQLELLHEVAPSASTVALLVNPTNPAISRIQSKQVPEAARKLGIDAHVLNASEERDFEPLFAKMKKLQVGGLVIGADTFLNARSDKLAALAVRDAIPTISPYREFARAGGLMSYGASINGASKAGRCLHRRNPEG
jgi:putative tryptophan/tyrosine transport system substrate-binding protein